MILFFEGLPGAGKSYSACSEQILPELKKGRRVFTNIARVNHEKFAELAGIDIVQCHELLYQITPDQCSQANIGRLWYQFPSGETVIDDEGNEIQGSLLQDSMLVIDEAQNIYPSTRQKLSAEALDLFARHRHFGMDIIVMSQAFASVHKDIRSRVQRKYTFAKLSALGMNHRYKWEAWEANQPEKFQKITGGNKAYDPKHFGLYASHTGGTENKAVLEDDRVNILKGFGFRFGVPSAFLAVFAAGWFLVHFFKTPPVQTPSASSAASKPANPPQPPVDSAPASAPTPAPAPVAHSQPKSEPPPTEAPPVDEFDSAAKSGRIRWSGYVKTPGREYAVIEVYEKGGHLIERYRTDELSGMGWTVKGHEWGYVISQGSTRHIARPWPKDDAGMVPQQARADLK